MILASLGLGSLTLSTLITRHSTYFLIISIVLLALAGFFTFRSYSKCSRGSKLMFFGASVGSMALIAYALLFK
jgi:hypothetical protein